MNRKANTLALACLLTLLTLPGSAHGARPVCGDNVCQGNEPTTCPGDCSGGAGGDDGDIPLRATFRDENCRVSGYDQLCSDGLGSYVDGVKGIAVEITKDGDLRLFLGVVNTNKKGSVKRSIVLDFIDRLTRDGQTFDPCASGGLCPPDPDLEPQNGVWLRTIFFGGADPKLNFRAMASGEVAPVRLFFPFSTTERNGFWLRFDPDSPNPGTNEGAGNVQVTASDENEDGLVDQWVLEPLPITDSKVKLIQNESGVITDFGDFRMPFLLTLARIE